MKTILLTIILLFIPNLCEAQRPNINLVVEANHNPATTLIKCEWAEAGALLNNDHKAIMWVLYRRAVRSIVRAETGTNDFSDQQIVEAAVSNHVDQNQLNHLMAMMALKYCNALHDNPSPPRTNHRAWAIRGMSRNWLERNAERHPRHHDLIQFVENWMRGEREPDPCSNLKVNGRAAGPALHWGSWADAHRHHWHTRYRIECGTFHNLFFDTENPT